MASPQDARALAKALVETATGAGCPTRALITDMNQPLALTAGNALEVAEVMETLTGRRITQTLWDLTVALGGELLALCGAQPDAARGGAAIAEALHRGHAAERFGAMVAALGGPGPCGWGCGCCRRRGAPSTGRAGCGPGPWPRCSSWAWWWRW
jgi:thymidine phosphorylase